MQIPWNVARWVNSVLERTLGVRITRVLQMKDVDAAVARLREWTPEDVIFDVGANDGRTILRLHQQLSRPRFFAFEPVSSTYHQLAERTRHLPNVQCFELALGAEEGVREIYLKDIPSANSFYPDWRTSVGSERVKVSTVDAVMAKEGVPFIHLLKIDAEGHDLEVLRGAREALSANRIGIVQVEVNFKRHRLSLDRFRAFLEPLGYRVSGLYTQKRVPASSPESWTEEEKKGYVPYVMKYGNAVFVSTSLSDGYEPLTPADFPSHTTMAEDEADASAPSNPVKGLR